MAAEGLDDERLFILRMVQEGKITADEAARLLEALEGSEPPVRRDPAPDASKTPPPGERVRERADELKRLARERAEEMRRSADELRRLARERAEEVRREVREKASQWRRHVEKIKEGIPADLGERIAADVEAGVRKGLSSFGNLAEWLRTLPWGGELGPAHQFTREVEGEFAAPDGRAIPVELATVNGAITVQPWERPGYRIVAVIRVRGVDKEEAAARAETAVEVQEGPDGIQVHAKERSRMQVELQAWLPGRLAYDLALRSTNGAVRASDLETRSLEATTTNGAVHLHGLRGARARVRG
ncbi:MAG TPA: hypothetical protein VF234_03495, partial [Limnochordia bacterium]